MTTEHPAAEPKMNKPEKVSSREVGLEIGYVISRFFLKSEHLHYGLFENGLDVDISNLKTAQEKYTDLILSVIPDGTRTILDVGCGTGKNAELLLDRGFTVDCVSPPSSLSRYARERLGDRVTFYVQKFQEVKTEKKYDLILFSESFQYMPMDQSMPAALSMLNPGGHILIADFFKCDPENRSLLGGGRDFAQWEAYRESLNMEVVYSRDITKETAPSIDLINQLNAEVLEPVWRSVGSLARSRFPKLSGVIRYLGRRKLAQLEQKHFSGGRTGENFAKYKRYMIYLLRR